MPVIYINIQKLKKLIGKESLSEDDLNEILFSLKSESKKIDEATLEVEVNSDRPDLFSVEGIARAIKGLTRKEMGLFEPKVKDSGFQAVIGEVPSRPYIAFGIVKGIELGEEGLKELIQFQEKLHVTVGRNRKKVAIGIHDLRKVPSINLTYSMVSLDREMKPLGDDKYMKIKDVLSNTQQGKSYGDISVLGGAHPAILSDGEIISLPPVINSEITRLEPNTKDLLIDVTGTEKTTVLKTLDLLCSVLNEHVGSLIERVEVIGPGSNDYRKDPQLGRTKIRLNENYIGKILGFEPSHEDIIESLLRMRFGLSEEQKGEIEVIVPEYRLDILHQIDLVEDVAMAYGYNRIPIKNPTFHTEGSLLNYTLSGKVARLILLGLGFQEVSSFTMVGEEAKMFEGENDRVIKIKNPISESMSFLRPNNIVSLLLVLRENQHVELPLKIFEMGDCAFESNGRVIQKKTIALALMKDELSFEEIQALVHSFLSSIGIDVKYRRDENKYFISGRTARVIANEIPIGILGEVHPHVLTSLGIKYPVGAAEIDMDILSKMIKK
jgi:phenylalanyl-tRNA synthetase beta chain